MGELIAQGGGVPWGDSGVYRVLGLTRGGGLFSMGGSEFGWADLPYCARFGSACALWLVSVLWFSVCRLVVN